MLYICISIVALKVLAPGIHAQLFAELISGERKVYLLRPDLSVGLDIKKYGGIKSGGLVVGVLFEITCRQEIRASHPVLYDTRVNHFVSYVMGFNFTILTASVHKYWFYC